MKKKGDIWVSAVLYIALGMVVITLILSAGVPLVNKMRDRNTIAQTKSMMFNIDENIQAVVNEAKGSTRFLSPVDINSGQLFIDEYKGGEDTNQIRWVMKTKNRLVEPKTDFTEGSMHLFLDETAIVEEYEMNLFLDYFDEASSKGINMSLASGYENPFQGRFSFTIKNNGPQPCGQTECPLEIQIEIT